MLELNYGKHDAKKIENVKTLFVEMDLEKAFKTYEEESYTEIQVWHNRIPVTSDCIYLDFISVWMCKSTAPDW